MRTHYYPYSSDEAEVAACGTLLGYGGDVTSNWGLVDCKRCLQRKSQIMAAHAAEGHLGLGRLAPPLQHEPGGREGGQRDSSQRQGASQAD